MKALPYFKWNPADAETDDKYSAMNDAELGFYHRCLNRSWLNDGLPSDLDELARVMKVKRTYLDKVWARVGKCFELTDTVRPRYINKRQEEERLAAISKSANNKRVGNANAFKSRSDRVLRVSESISDSSSDSKKEPLPFKKRSDAAPSWESVNEAWAWYKLNFPKEVNEFMELQLFISVMETPQDIEDLKRNLPEWKRTKQWIDGYIPTSENFLSKRLFKVAPKGRDSPSPQEHQFSRPYKPYVKPTLPDGCDGEDADIIKH